MAKGNNWLLMLAAVIVCLSINTMYQMGASNSFSNDCMQSLFDTDWKTNGGEGKKLKTSNRDIGIKNNNIDIDDEDKRLETAVIILTSLIPSHPSLHILDKTMGSLQNLQGLHPKAPIFVTVDPPPLALKLYAQALDDYIQALYRRFRGKENDHVTVVVNGKHAHISGSILRVLTNHFDPEKTKYMYVLQHDLMFTPEKIIDHTAIVKAFEQYSENDALRLVRFNQYPNRRNVRNKCPNRTALGISDPLTITSGNTNGQPPVVYLTFTKKWSDNNHITTVDYYKELFQKIGPTPRAPEHVMGPFAPQHCVHWGSHLYGSSEDGMHICHLDGRNQTSNETYNVCEDI